MKQNVWKFKNGGSITFIDDSKFTGNVKIIDETGEFISQQFDYLKERTMKELPKTIVRYGYRNEPDCLRHYDVAVDSITHIRELGKSHQAYVNRQDACSIGVYALVREFHKEEKKFVHTSKDNRSYHYSQLATPHLRNILAQERLNPRKRAILEYELERREMEGKK